MAHEVKLDVYTLQIKKHGEEKFVGFDEFYEDPDDAWGEKPEKNFESFFTDYITSFDRKFWVQQISGKAINISDSHFKFASRQRMIYGNIDGGVTGIGSKIKMIEDISDEHAFQVTTEHVESIPYYFRMWIPDDSNIGLLIIQSLGNKSISDIFRAHLRKFFNDNTRGLTLLIHEHIPKVAAKTMREKGIINSIILRRLHLPSDKAEKILGLQYVDENITVEIKVTGIKKFPAVLKKIKDFMNGKVTSIIDTEPLEEYGIDGQHETLIKFEHDGKTAIGKSSNGFKLAPSYYVAETDINRDAMNHPTFESIDGYCKTFLESMKKEIGYRKVKK